MHGTAIVPARDGGTYRPPQPSSRLRVSRTQFRTRSPRFAETLAQLERYARYDHLLVLLEGESGTGKSFLAEYLHDCSPRSGGAFHTVVLSTLEDSIATSELFGHVKGAYTDARSYRAGAFVSASGGTLFLDEIGKASLAVQHRLLHVVEQREVRPVGSDRPVRVDTRIVAATNIPLQEAVEAGAFLSDLVPRLAAFPIRIPPLRDRREDIPLLVEQFIEMRAPQCGYAAHALPTVHPRLMQALCEAPWPYNLRQLDATLQLLLVEADGTDELRLSHLRSDALCMDREESLPLTMERVAHAVELLGSVTAAARFLGVSRSTVYRYLSQTARAAPLKISDAE